MTYLQNETTEKLNDKLPSGNVLIPEGWGKHVSFGRVAST
jgi:hypothetical protein